MFQKPQQSRWVPVGVFLLLVACESKKLNTSQELEPDETVVVIPEKKTAKATPTTNVVYDVGIADVSKKVEEPIHTKTEAAGTLCIKEPGVHNSVGKGSAKRNPSKNEQASRRKRAKMVNRGFTIEVGEQTTTVKGNQGSAIEGLALHERHRVKVRFSTGKSHHGFGFRFEENETQMCAYYNSFYDNWRVRKVRKKCGPCSKG